MDIKEKIAVMQEFANGKQIECRSIGSTEWKINETPLV